MSLAPGVFVVGQIVSVIADKMDASDFVKNTGVQGKFAFCSHDASKLMTDPDTKLYPKKRVDCCIYVRLSMNYKFCFFNSLTAKSTALAVSAIYVKLGFTEFDDTIQEPSVTNKLGIACT